MYIVVVTNNHGELTISADTMAHVNSRDTNTPVLSFANSVSLFHLDDRKVCLTYIGNPVVKGVFIANILNGFIETMRVEQDETDLPTLLYFYLIENWGDFCESLMDSLQFCFAEIVGDNIHFTKVQYKMAEPPKEIETLIQPGYTCSFTKKNVDSKLTVDNKAEFDAAIQPYLANPTVQNAYSRTVSNTEGKLIHAERNTLTSYLIHLDDYISATLSSHLPSIVSGPISRSELYSHVTDEAVALTQKPGYRRFIKYSEFVKIARMRIINPNAYRIYQLVFNFFNRLANEDPILLNKVKKVLDFGVLFVFDNSDPREDEDSVACYQKLSRTIYVFVDRMSIMPQFCVERILTHELEHALQNVIHSERWMNETKHDPFLQAKTLSADLSDPIYPNNDEQRHHFLSNFRLGKERLEVLFHLFDKPPETLTENQKKLISIVDNRAQHYEPLLHKSKERTTDVQENQVYLPIHSVIYLIRDTPDPMYKDLWFTISNKAHALVRDILITCEGFEDDISELEARTIGEIPIHYLALFFPESIAYAESDYQSAFPGSQLYGEPYDQEVKTFMKCIAQELREQKKADKLSFFGSEFEIKMSKLATVFNQGDDGEATATALSQCDYSKSIYLLSQSGHKKAFGALKLILRYMTKPGLANDFDINMIYEGKNALYHASEKQDSKLYHLLVSNGANEN